MHFPAHHGVRAGVVFLVAAIHNPRRAAGAWIYAALIGVAALLTIGVAAPACLHTKSAAGQHSGLRRAVQCPAADVPRLAGRGEGAARGGRVRRRQLDLVGLSMPGWVLFCALILGGAGVIANIPRRPPALRMR